MASVLRDSLVDLELNDEELDDVEEISFDTDFDHEAEGDDFDENLDLEEDE